MHEIHLFKETGYKPGGFPTYYMGKSFFAIRIPADFETRNDYLQHVLQFEKPNKCGVDP